MHVILFGLRLLPSTHCGLQRRKERNILEQKIVNVLGLSLQRLFMMEDRQVVAAKMEDPSNAVEFRDVTLAWEKARPPPAPRSHPPPKKPGGMMRVLRREKLSLYIPSEDSKGNQDSPNTQSLLTNMEQESPQSTISSTQSIRPPLHKTLHRIDLRVKKVNASGLFPSKEPEHRFFFLRGCYISSLFLGLAGWNLWQRRQREELAAVSSAGTGDFQL